MFWEVRGSNYQEINGSCGQEPSARSWLSRLFCCVAGKSIDKEPENLRQARISSVDCVRSPGFVGRNSAGNLVEIFSIALPSQGFSEGSRSISPISPRQNLNANVESPADQKMSLIAKSQLSCRKISSVIQLLKQPDVKAPAIRVTHQVARQQFHVNIAYADGKGWKRRKAFLISLEEVSQLSSNGSNLVVSLKAYLERRCK